jgi:hypothetical protein
MKKIRDWLIATYNGLYVIVLKPYMPNASTIAALVVGVLIGLIWAYALAPTVFYNADPSSLDQSWQNEWVSLLADRYANATSTGAATDELNNSMITLLRAVDNPVGIVDNLGQTRQIPPGFRELAQLAEPGKPAPEPSAVGNIAPFIIAPIVVVIVAVVLILVWGLLIYGNIVVPILKRLGIIKTQASDAATQKTMESLRAAKEAEAKARELPQVENELGTPVIRRMSVYIMGRGQYDDSFEIEDSNEMFLGECGATIAETIGTGEPEKVTAVEVWLFDKDDFVRTMTNVFVSEHAYNDPAIRSKLETKGDLVLIRPGAVATLDTNTLRLQARIVDMAYGSGPLPPNSYFEKLTIEMAVWQKPAGTTVSAAPVAMPVMQAAPAQTYMPPPPQVSQTYAPNPAPPQTLPGAQPPPPSMSPPRRQDDDPFGGTGDFTPIS